MSAKKSEGRSYLDIIVGNVEPPMMEPPAEPVEEPAGAPVTRGAQPPAEGTLAAPVGKRAPRRARRENGDAIRLRWLHGTRDRMRLIRFVAVLALALAAVGLLAWSGRGSVLLALAALGILIAGALYWFSTGETDERIRKLEIEIEIADDSEAERDAYRLFQLHQIELNRYYNHTLRNSRVLMAAGLLCLAVGVGIVGGTIWWVTRAVPQTGGDAQAAATDWRITALVALLGAVGGILANYVAALYLKMHAAASQALNDFHNRLVSTHHLHVANFLAAKITKEETRELALKTMAEEIAKR
jgi:hypothetical protein